MANGIVHFEVYCDDVVRAKQFYYEVFGWAYQDMGPEFNDYVVVYPGGEISDGPAEVGINGGMLKRPGPAPADDMATANAFVCVVSVDDIERTLARVELAGGRIDMPVTYTPTVGKMAYIRDTEMNLVGILQPEQEGM